jgi:aconitate hydratase
MVVGGEIGVRIDQTLTQDATGTTAFLLFEAIGVPRVATELSVSYVDHNMAQFGPENHNDHLYLQSIAGKVGAYHSRPGNGICHQVHLERFARPGRTLLGSDSHTPTGGGMGMIAIGAGGLDVAVAMGGGAFYMACPKVIGVELVGQLPAWVSAKDIILRLLSILTTKGNVGCVVEYFGEGVAGLPVPARATCTNMGAELGVTCSIFPSDEVTRQFLAAQGREDQYIPLAADDGAKYDRVITINLDELEPLAAAPSSPDNIVRVADIAGQKIAQIGIGSCTNSSFWDLMTTAAMLKGRTVHPGVELAVAPGSRQVLSMIAANGALADLVTAGARIMESACGPCIGVGFSPADGAVSLRTFNRNFAGRSGTAGDKIFLVSPETAAASALAGEICDPREAARRYGMKPPVIAAPSRFPIDDGMLQRPLTPKEAGGAEVIRGSTIVKPPGGERPPQRLDGAVIIKVGDKITTDHIMPAGSFLKFRSNVPEYAKYVFNCFNDKGKPSFADRALGVKALGQGGVIVAGESYGQGSSREHAALCPMYLGVRAVIARSIERIHQANLVNFGIVPLTLTSAADYDRLDQGDRLVVEDLAASLAEATVLKVANLTKGCQFTCQLNLAPRQRKILSAGGLLAYTREGGQ